MDDYLNNLRLDIGVSGSDVFAGVGRDLKSEMEFLKMQVFSPLMVFGRRVQGVAAPRASY